MDSIKFNHVELSATYTKGDDIKKDALPPSKPNMAVNSSENFLGQLKELTSELSPTTQIDFLKNALNDASYQINFEELAEHIYFELLTQDIE